MKKTFLIAACLATVVWSISRPPEVPFEKSTIDIGAAEPAAFADINGDGKLDIVSGEFWYEAPRWIQHRFRELEFHDGYIDDFSDLPLDVNGDGRVDIISCTWMAKRLYWMENPGKTGAAWKAHEIDGGRNFEFSFLVDLDNDGKARELLPDSPNATVWFEVKNGEFVKHAISSQVHGHGIGAGDVNGDGRNDIITPKGWFEAPSDPRSGDWKWHGDFDLGGTAFIHVLDINGDGRPDLVTSMAHDYGVFWMEQLPDGKWAKHMIDDTWSQAHSILLVDVNGDGQKDLLTGKRYMAHDHDPGAREPLGLYWYEYRKDGGKVVWIKHVIDYSTRTGAGIQIAAADIDGDGALDIAVGGKSGLYLFRNLSKRK